MASETVTVPVKFLKLSDSLVQRGKIVLSMQGSMKHLVREMMKSLSAELAKNNIESVKLWKEVEAEAKAQGITLDADEGFYFDYITDQYYISKMRKVTDT